MFLFNPNPLQCILSPYLVDEEAKAPAEVSPLQGTAVAEPGFVRVACGVCACGVCEGVNTSQGCQVSLEKPGSWGLAEP